MEIKFSFDETNVQVGFENQFVIKDLTDKTLVKLLMLKGEKGDTGSGADWGNIGGTITDQTDLINLIAADLANYYLKTQTYSKSEVDTLISAISSLDIEVVASLPSSDISTSTIYLVPKTGSTNDIYNEYIYVNSAWELIGTTEVDLSNYYTSTQVDNLLADKQDTLVSGTNIKTINNTSLLGSGNISIGGSGGTATDVQINGTSITSNDVANIITETAYDSSSNKIATMSDVPTATSDLTNDSGFITSSSLPTKTSDLTNDSGFITSSSLPTKTSDLTNDSGFIDNTVNDLTNYTLSSSLASVATSGSYNDLSNTPTIPTVNDATLTIQKNGTTIDTFTANSSTNTTVNVTVPTAVSELTNDSGYVTSNTDVQVNGTSIVSSGTANLITNTAYDSSSNKLATMTDVNTKQDTLVSGTNIKTINSISLLGNGNIDISGLTTVTSNSINIWDDMDYGLYYLPANCTVNYGASSIAFTSPSLLFVTVASTFKTWFLTTGTTMYGCMTYSSTTSGTLQKFITSDKIKNNLTTTTSGSYVLDAYQGYLLNQNKANTSDLATVATSGDYSDLSNTPTIPTATSDLTNDSGFITTNNDIQVNGTSIVSSNVANLITNTAYDSSSNKLATMSDIPTATSDLTNDSDFAVTNSDNNFSTDQTIYGDVVAENVLSKNMFPLTLYVDNTAINQANCTITLDDDEFTLTATSTYCYMGEVIASGSSYANRAGALIDVSGLSSITYTLSNTGFDSVYITAYDSSKVSLGYTYKSGYTNTYTIPSGASYISFRFGVSLTTSGTSYSTTVQIERGSTATTYTKYHNFVNNEPIVLFKETSTLTSLNSQSSITLRDDVSNYSYIEIFYCRFGAFGKSIKYVPSLMNTAVIDLVLYVNSVFRIYTTTLQFSGTTVNLINKAFSNDFSTPSVSENNVIVYKILGYK